MKVIFQAFFLLGLASLEAGAAELSPYGALGGALAGGAAGAYLSDPEGVDAADDFMPGNDW